MIKYVCMNKNYIRGYEFDRRIRGVSRRIGERETWSICIVLTHENKKQALIICIEICNFSMEKVWKLVDN